MISKSQAKFVAFFVFFLVLFCIRFVISTLFFNNDFRNHHSWVQFIVDRGFQGLYEHDFSPWAHANYPPLANIMFYVFDRLYFSLIKAPLNLDLLASFYKLPGIFVETILIVFLFFKRKWTEGLLLALNPAIVYNTLFWGQTDGLISVLVVFSIYALFSQRELLASILFASALLVKESALAFIPIIGLITSKILPRKKIIVLALFSITLIAIFFIPFTQKNPLLYSFRFFSVESGGQTHQHLASVNAFNFWYLLGLNEVGDTTHNLRSVGFVIVALFLIPIVAKIINTKIIKPDFAFFALGIAYFAVFLFLTRMHERHFLPVLFLLLPLAASSIKNLISYLVLSVIHFLNLYMVWGEPKILLLDKLLTPINIHFMIVVELVAFIYLYYEFLRPKVVK